MISFEDLVWQSDWMGYEVGHKDDHAIGLYLFKVNPSIMFYYDYVDCKIVEVFCECENNEGEN